MKQIVTLFLLFISVSCFSQNKQVLYNFAELPQSLLLNPGMETNYKFHVGVPLLSGISTEVGISNMVLSDLFLDDQRDINDKLAAVIHQTLPKDDIQFNLQLEVINAGFRLNDETYLSFGFYEELDMVFYFPKDMMTLLYDGNYEFLNKSFHLSHLRFKIDGLGVLHAGVTRKINKKLTVGARFKIYSSIANIESTHNSGTLTTFEGQNNIYKHYLNDVNIQLRSSGLYADDAFISDPSSFLKNSFLGPNKGIGFDFGMTYHFSDQLEFSGSILDLGFIKHKKNIQNYSAIGDYGVEGIGLQYDPSNPTDYWFDLDESFQEEIPVEENTNSYTSWRPTKLNAALSYRFGQKRSRVCYENTIKDFYTHGVGAQLYSVFRPLQPEFELTGFYTTSFSDKFHTKFTYTVNKYSFYNVGAGFSMQMGKVNFYGMLDNVFQYRDLASANNLSLQFGFNLIFN